MADVLAVDIASLDLPAALDGVAYCPGSLNLKSFRALTETDVLDDFRVSALGAVRVLQATATALKAGRQPGVVLFSTVAVRQGMPFTRALADEHAARRAPAVQRGTSEGEPGPPPAARGRSARRRCLDGAVPAQ